MTQNRYRGDNAQRSQRDWDENPYQDDRRQNSRNNSLDNDRDWQRSNRGQSYQDDMNNDYGNRRGNYNYNTGNAQRDWNDQDQYNDQDQHNDYNNNSNQGSSSYGQGSSYGGGRGYNDRNYPGGMQHNTRYGGQQYSGRGSDSFSLGMHNNRNDPSRFGNTFDRYGSSYNRSNDLEQFDNSGTMGSGREPRGYNSGSSYSTGMGSSYGTTAGNYGLDNSYGNVNSGQHQGKGPKGYHRSDERIKEDVSDRLTDDAHLDASQIEVEVKNGEVTLTGSVEGRESKRRAEDLVEAVSGVSNVENRLHANKEKQSDNKSSAMDSSMNSDSKNKQKSLASAHN